MCDKCEDIEMLINLIITDHIHISSYHTTSHKYVIKMPIEINLPVIEKKRTYSKEKTASQAKMYQLLKLAMAAFKQVRYVSDEVKQK